MVANDRPARLLIDADRCQGHNRCFLLAPELIEIDELGFAHVKAGGAVPSAFIEKARLAVRNCPEFALRLAHVPPEGGLS